MDSGTDTLIRLAMDAGYDTVIILAKHQDDPRSGLVGEKTSPNPPQKKAEEFEGLLSQALKDLQRTDDEAGDDGSWFEADSFEAVRAPKPSPVKLDATPVKVKAKGPKP